MLWIISVFGGILLVDQRFKEVHGALVEKSGCFHNGTLFAGGSLVPTMEPCLSCQCNERTLVCSLKICPEMPVPPPRGCVLVQKKNVCCPYLSCTKYHTLYNGPNRRIVAYLDHFEKETLDRMVNENVLYRRSDDSDLDGSGEICVQNGTVYKSGSAMSSSSLCSYCYCIGGSQKCVKPKCMLAMEGCKPIFVDSTCCPVRYDCSSKSSGIMKSRNHIRRAGNKHYQRMAQRLQRGRGCIANSHFYIEGQKMPADTDKACDICFCIRGSRKCAPKKCAPALRNCIPVVPKGQCCPSSYDCGITKDFDRAYLSRQFDLFSLLFGSDEAENATASSSAPQTEEIITEHTSEKSIFDAIREGLEFIDNNEGSVSNVLEDLNDDDSKTTEQNETKDQLIDDEDDKISFFDIILSTTSLPSINKSNNFVKLPTTSFPTTKIISKLDHHRTKDGQTESAEDDGDANLFDLVAEEQSYSPNRQSKPGNETTTTGQYSDYSSYPDNENSYDEYSGFGPTGDSTAISTEGIDEESTYENEIVIEDSSTTTESGIRNSNTGDDVSQEKESNVFSSTLENDTEEFNAELNMDITSSTDTSPTVSDNLDERDTTTESMPNPSTSIVQSKTTQVLQKSSERLDVNTSTENSSISPNTENHKEEIVTATEQSEVSQKPSEDFLSVLFNGLSTIFKEEGNETDYKQKNMFNETNVEATSLKHDDVKTTDHPLSSSSPVTTIVENITESKAAVSVISTTNRNTNDVKNELMSPKIEKPIIIKTNPSILEADINLDYNEPTLPPSLPNLKIIPFLPADAVKADRKQVVYDYFNIKPTSFPSITTKPDAWGINTATKNPDPKLDFDRYPSITEKYDPTLYPENYVPFENHKKYGYDDYEYSDFDLPNRNQDKYIDEYIHNKYNNPIKKFDTVLTNIDKKQYHGVIRTDIPGFDFDHQVNRFSPPTKTEGGFVPKDPTRDDNFYYDNFHTTKFIVDLTTSAPKVNQNTSKHGISTPDPFRDVIKTEPPPDLHSLIEDKEKFLANGVATTFYESPNAADTLVFEKDIISITTDSNYNYTSEYKDANEIVLLENGNISKMINSSNVSIINLKVEAGDVLLNETTTVRSISEDNSETNVNTLAESAVKVNKNESNVQDLSFDVELENVLNILFKSNHSGGMKNRTNNKVLLAEKLIPPPLNEVLNKTNIETSSTTTEDINEALSPASSDDMSIFKDALLSSFKDYESSTMKYHITKDTSMAPNQFLPEPFNKLPFLNPSFPVKPQVFTPGALGSDLDLVLTNLKNEAYNSEKHFHPGGYEILPNDSTESDEINPADVDKLAQHQSEGPTQVFTKPDTTGSLRDPAGILKLAGCNIYGRMYRVGRIISELSGPCLECKCTEIGVHCTPLEC